MDFCMSPPVTEAPLFNLIALLQLVMWGLKRVPYQEWLLLLPLLAYNPLWVLAFSVIFFHFALSSHNFLHPLIPIICISFQCPQSIFSLVFLCFSYPLVVPRMTVGQNVGKCKLQKKTLVCKINTCIKKKTILYCNTDLSSVTALLNFDNSVSIATHYRLDSPGIESW
jgi:hypothetical protein